MRGTRTIVLVEAVSRGPVPNSGLISLDSLVVSGARLSLLLPLTWTGGSRPFGVA